MSGYAIANPTLVQPCFCNFDYQARYRWFPSFRKSDSDYLAFTLESKPLLILNKRKHLCTQ